MPDYGYVPACPYVGLPMGRRDACAEHFCEGCGRPFSQTRRWQKFCRPSCRYAADRRKHDERIRREALLPFMPKPKPPKPDPQTARLSRQCADLLEWLQLGPVTNRAMADRALNYRARISELRQAGHHITIVRRDRTTGLTTYALEGR